MSPGNNLDLGNGATLAYTSTTANATFSGTQIIGPKRIGEGSPQCKTCLRRDTLNGKQQVLGEHFTSCITTSFAVT